MKDSYIVPMGVAVAGILSLGDLESATSSSRKTELKSVVPLHVDTLSVIMMETNLAWLEI